MRYTMLFLTASALFVSIPFATAQEKKGGKKGGFTLPPMIHITIADLTDGGHILSKYTCAAGQMSPSPAISWSGAPNTTQSYALIMHDPDPVLGGSATNDVLHWAIFDSPGDSKGYLKALNPATRPTAPSRSTILPISRAIWAPARLPDMATIITRSRSMPLTPSWVCRLRRRGPIC